MNELNMQRVSNIIYDLKMRQRTLGLELMMTMLYDAKNNKEYEQRLVHYLEKGSTIELRDLASPYGDYRVSGGGKVLDHKNGVDAIDSSAMRRNMSEMEQDAANIDDPYIKRMPIGGKMVSYSYWAVSQAIEPSEIQRIEQCILNGEIDGHINVEGRKDGYWRVTKRNRLLEVTTSALEDEGYCVFDYKKRQYAVTLDSDAGEYVARIYDKSVVGTQTFLSKRKFGRHRSAIEALGLILSGGVAAV